MKKKENINYVGIGIFIFVGLILFLIGLFFAGKYSYKFGGGYKLNVEFTFVDNLSPSAKVRVLGGTDIGFVNDIQFKGDRLNVVLVIEGKYKINRSSTFHIYSTGVVGTKYISIEHFNPNEGVFFEDGEVITGRSPVGMSQMMDSLGDMMAAVMGDSEGEIIGNISGTFKNVSDLIENLNNIVKNNEADVRRAVHSLAIASKNLETLSGAMTNIDQSQIDTIVKNLEVTSKELRKITEALNSKDGLMTLAKDKKFTKSIKTTVKNLEAFTKILKDKPNAIIVGK